MFNPFKKQKENPIGEVFSDLTKNQKMSVMNFLQTIAVADNVKSEVKSKVYFLNNYVRFLGVKAVDSISYLESGGISSMVSDLKGISENQKEMLIGIAYELMTLNGKPTQNTISVAGNLFEEIGFNEEQFISIMEKQRALMNFFRIS